MLKNLENIEQARQEFLEVVLPIHTCRRMVLAYIASCKEMLVIFEAKRHLPKHALQARLRIQAAEEWLNKH